MLKVWHTLAELGTVCQNKPKNGIKLGATLKKNFFICYLESPSANRSVGSDICSLQSCAGFFSSHFLSYPSGSLAPRLDEQGWLPRTLLGTCLVPQPKTSCKYCLLVSGGNGKGLQKPHFRCCSSSKTGGLLLKEMYEAMTLDRSRNHAWYLQVTAGVFSVALRSCWPA